MSELLNLDRAKLAAELLIIERTGFCPGINGWEPEDMKDYISSSFFPVKLSAAFDIRRAIRELSKASSDVESFMPSRLLSIAGMSLYELAFKYDYSDYIDWLDELHEENERLKAQTELAENSLGAYLDMDTSALLSAVTKQGNLRAVIVSEDGDIVMRLAERNWGKASVRFKSATCTGCPGLPMPCYAYRIEGEYADGRFRFCLMCDTRFSQNDYLLRMLEREDWYELIIECEDVRAELEMYDYYSRQKLRGSSKRMLFEECLSVIVSKSKVLGESSLNEPESGLLAAARLFVGLEAYDKAKNADDRERAKALALQGLDDRYNVSRLASELSKIYSGRLSLLLGGASDCLVRDDERGAMTRASAFYTLFCDCASKGMLYSYFDGVCTELELASGLYEDDLGCAAAAAEYVDKNLTPLIKRKGFLGEYPCFSRNVQGYTELLTVVLRPDSDRLHSGVRSERVSLSCARTHSSRLDKQKELELNALDCEGEAMGYSDYTELCGGDDGVDAFVEKDCISGRYSLDRTAILNALRIADHGMKTGSVPFSYRVKMTRARGFFSQMGKALSYDLHIPAAVFVLLLGGYMWFGSSLEAISEAKPLHVVLAALALSLGLYVLYAAYDALRCSAKFWRQK